MAVPVTDTYKEQGLLNAIRTAAVDDTRTLRALQEIGDIQQALMRAVNRAEEQVTQQITRYIANFDATAAALTTQAEKDELIALRATLATAAAAELAIHQDAWTAGTAPNIGALRANITQLFTTVTIAVGTL